MQRQGVHGVCGVPGPCQLTRATVMDVVSIDEFEDFLFIMGIPASDLIFVDPYLQDLQLTRDVFAMVRRLLYLHRGASRSPTPEHIAEFRTLRDHARSRRRAHTTHIAQVCMVVRGRVELRERHSLMHRIADYLQAPGVTFVPVSRMSCVGHGCHFECDDVLAFIAHVKGAHLDM